MEWTPDRIRTHRLAHGWSQVELAHHLSAAQPGARTTSPRSITDWETGRAVPSGRNITALDKVFGAGTQTGGLTVADADDIELLTELLTRHARRRKNIHDRINIGDIPDDILDNPTIIDPDKPGELHAGDN